jgi:hypothetical protein
LDGCRYKAKNGENYGNELRDRGSDNYNERLSQQKSNIIVKSLSVLGGVTRAKIPAVIATTSCSIRVI